MPVSRDLQISLCLYPGVAVCLPCPQSSRLTWMGPWPRDVLITVAAV